ncbi:MAG: ATP-binding protein [Phycisphaerales bacterium]|nr:ATP-binding protein [Phycisphaerales bacterium]
MSDDKPPLGDPQSISNRVGQVFHPSAPVDVLDFFTGRVPQYRQLLDTLGERGRHAIVYGERAVGKTSLVSILKPLVQAMNMPHFVHRAGCGTKETFASLWRVSLRNTVISQSAVVPVLLHTEAKTIHESADRLGCLPENPTPVDVSQCLVNVPGSVYIFDEFDRLHRNERRLFADLLKMLSDQLIDTTLILVGVADTVDDLVSDHRSITRAVAQVRVPRMNPSEIREILERGEKALGVVFSDDAKVRIQSMAQGLPHYAHLLGKHGVREATKSGRLDIRVEDIVVAERTALAEVDQAAMSIYLKATQSARKDAIFQHVLLACALAPKDELGFFRPAAIANPLSVIRGNKDVEFSTFMRHLAEFVKKTRGPILQRSGPQRNYKYRFLDPLLPPLAILKGLEKSLLTERQLTILTADPGDVGPLFTRSASTPL